ncbi:hypothetical protein SPRG_21460 [Saprolegnia parasitica CBS 223.65]|uniref:Uncharacterized protein n=1 Tax=Saprolegnia parasitica (strain CBS 223.65) TaxID=695850 RepID=A0A067BLW0_SAPPC|nr:hypothetical protein SPRG_21460 [Saprolegnia parasitica CBS 223.65]KDO19168.1 hypothetical protein SPRG_21460 [Saprolegnia parasitica CBS 223.65]|eukprot:XP_012210122.1 hypothetical protein SPRG_21460 [Saprolegnia parasitica CBS 223.65]
MDGAAVHTHGARFFESNLPREELCTENLSPWLKLLPCRSHAGLESLGKRPSSRCTRRSRSSSASTTAGRSRRPSAPRRRPCVSWRPSRRSRPSSRPRNLRSSRCWPWPSIATATSTSTSCRSPAYARCTSHGSRRRRHPRPSRFGTLRPCTDT